jgi:hypothetical protein
VAGGHGDPSGAEGCCGGESASSLGGELAAWPAVVGRLPAHPIGMMTLLLNPVGFQSGWLVLSLSAGLVLSAAGIVEWR